MELKVRCDIATRDLAESSAFSLEDEEGTLLKPVITVVSAGTCRAGYNLSIRHALQTTCDAVGLAPGISLRWWLRQAKSRTCFSKVSVSAVSF